MEEYKNAKIFSRTIDETEKAAIIVILEKEDFSIFCFSESYRNIRLVKPFEEHIGFHKFDTALDLYEGQYHIEIKTVWSLLLYLIGKKISGGSPREDEEIEKKLYYERGFRLCSSEERKIFLEKIKKIKDKGK